MRYRLSAIVACLLALLSGAAFAQTAPSAEDIQGAWQGSPHANAGSAAFRHWDAEGKIPGACAVCHSTAGVVDYLAGRPFAAGVIDHAVPTGSTVECAACHNSAAKSLREVPFPSGTVVNMPAGSAICAVCHQGRASADTVVRAVAGLSDDQVSTDLSFINIHYGAAAATRLGHVARGGYEYPGQGYAGPFRHAEGFDSCVSCHGAHQTRVELKDCTGCHRGAADFRAIRTTPLDILGKGNTSAGIAIVIDDLKARLRAAIIAYASRVTDRPIVYSATAYPYFFNDLNANGVVDDGEATFPNRYRSWTPRLLRAAYNYQFVGKDPGAFAHNPRYAIQLLIDSLQDLAKAVPVDVTGLVRP